MSVSRVENGQVRPRPDRLAKIADHLGLSIDALEARATAREKGLGNASTIDDRLSRVAEANAARTQLVDDFEAFQQARLKAEHSFLRRLRDVASRIDSAPQIEPERLAEGDGAKAEAAFQIEFTKFGVATALARPSGRPNLDSPDDSGDNLAFEQAVAVGSAALGKSLPLLGVAALNAFRKSVGTNRLAAGATGTLGGAELLGGIGIAALLGTIAGFLAAGKRSAKQQEELAAKLDAAEADIADTQPSVDALRELIPDTTDLLNYIAVHATHALERWEARIGPGPHEWSNDQNLWIGPRRGGVE